jgi:hypothetical protein
MTVSYIGSLTIADVFPNVYDLMQKLTVAFAADAALQAAMPSLNAALDILTTIEGGLDFMVTAPFGLNALKLSAVLEFQGSLRAIAGLSLAISNPLAQASAAISAMAAAMASLTASLSLGLPSVSAELGMQLSAITAVSAAAAAKMAGIQIVIDAGMSLLGPLVSVRAMIESLIGLFADLTLACTQVGVLATEFIAHLPSPGVYLYSGETLYQSFTPVLGPPPSGLTSDTAVKAVVMLVDQGATPSTWTSLQFMVRTS